MKFAFIFGLANLGGSLTYEVARKLKENMPDSAQSYLREWGFAKGLGLMLVCAMSAVTLSLNLMEKISPGFVCINAVVLITLLLGIFLRKSRKLFELVSVILNLSILWLALFI